MKTKLPDNAKTAHMLKKCRKIYAVGCWAKYGVAEYDFSGKCDENGVPLVWDFTDHNGERDEWILRNIYETTTVRIYAWTDIRLNAEFIASTLNRQAGFDREGVI